MESMHQKNKKPVAAITKQLVFCAIVAALSLIFLGVGSVTVLDLSAVVLCALATMVVFVECGRKLSWIMVAVTGLLALLLLPSKILAVLYIGVGGIYPICKASFEKLRPLFAWPVKLSCFLTMMLAVVVLSKLIFTAEEPFFEYSWLYVLIGSVFFVLFDLALTTCITFYIVKIRRRLRLKSLF